MNKNMTMLKALLLIALLASAASAAGVGTTGAQFLESGVGARPLAMGSAFTALADDVNAVNWNPGALGVVKQDGVSLSYNSLFQDENQGFIGVAHPTEKLGTFAGSLNYLMVSNIAKRAGDTESPDSTFTDQNFALAGSWGRTTPVQGLSIGGSVKYIRETLDTFHGNSLAFDAGLLYQTPCPNLSVGAMMQNLGAKIGPDPLPTSFKGGVAYKAEQQRLNLASDVEWHAVDKRAYLDLGAEYWAAKQFAVRTGYQFGHAQDQLSSSFVGASFGVGVKTGNVSVDYAFLPFGNLGDTHRVTLGWLF